MWLSQHIRAEWIEICKQIQPLGILPSQHIRAEWIEIISLITANGTVKSQHIRAEWIEMCVTIDGKAGSGSLNMYVLSE